jgi:small-conductance mechanosensitive channel
MDILGLVGLANIVIFMFYLETITIRMEKKFKRKHLVYYFIAWLTALFPIFFGFFWAIGAKINTKAMIFDILIIAFSLLIIDYLIYRICVFLYRKNNFFRMKLGHDLMRERWREKRKKQEEIND